MPPGRANVGWPRCLRWPSAARMVTAFKSQLMNRRVRHHGLVTDEVIQKKSSANESASSPVNCRIQRLRQLASHLPHFSLVEGEGPLTWRTESPPSDDSVLPTTTSPYRASGKFQMGELERAAKSESPACAAEAGNTGAASVGGIQPAQTGHDTTATYPKAGVRGRGFESRYSLLLGCAGSI